jgi:hypothetical protein
LSWLRDRLGARGDWFGLYAEDGRIDDKMWCDRVERGEFRLHPAVGRGISKGCITLKERADFHWVRRLLLRDGSITIPGTALAAYGVVSVS